MPGEWREVTIAEVASVKGGKRLPKGEPLQTIPTEHPYIRLVDIVRRGGEMESA